MILRSGRCRRVGLCFGFLAGALGASAAMPASSSAPIAPAAATLPAEKSAPQPLYRDPVYDGAADPVVVWNPHTRQWWMFYTNRRANVPGLSGVAWVHGSPIGIAESDDGGVTWTYAGTADIELPAEIAGPGAVPTFWAPDVRTAPDGTHHMFLTVVPGIFEDWQHPRTIVHLTSPDLRHWKYDAALTLASDRVIDPCVVQLPDGTWRMWYNNERDRKSIYFADSPDLSHWTDRGKCEGVGERPGEGPFVFAWKGHHWMLVDLWKGLGVYRSDDLLHWTAQPDNLLGVPGHGADDGVNGGHPGVVVSGDRAFCFYFTHPGRAGTIAPDDKNASALRRSSIQVVELFEQDGRLTCDRDAPTHIALIPPGE
jgi:sucrose-6-phosphate hydrolase SacC (GH32 family)